MGILGSKSLESEPARVLIIGLSGSGKTTLLYNMMGVPDLTVIPTIGFNVETFARDNVKFTAWDVGGRGKIKALWRHYSQQTEGVLYVVDAVDRSSLDEAAEEFIKLIQTEEFANIPFVVLANKYDLPDAIPIREIVDKFMLAEAPVPVTIQIASVKNKEGTEQAFKWLAEQITTRRAMGHLPVKIAD